MGRIRQWSVANDQVAYARTGCKPVIPRLEPKLSAGLMWEDVKMKFRTVRIDWAIAPTALALVFAIASATHGNPIQTPLSAPLVVVGNSSGGTESNTACSGFLFPPIPNQSIQVQDATALQFRVEGSGDQVLLITGPGNPICIPVDSTSGFIEVPGIWQIGTYSVFVGDRSSGGHPFTLSITEGL
jgi:hypothetical protein